MNDREQAARRICRTLRQHGFRALLAGGCVRDLLLNVEPRDYDIATTARPAQVKDLFPRAVEVGVEFGVIGVTLPEGQFEVTTFRADGPYSDGRHPDYVFQTDEQGDALRRDFTINAMFYDPETEKILDYAGGQEDLRQGILRAVGDPRKRFEEDHLRLLRAVRFAARLEYAIEPETRTAMEAMAALATQTSAERIRDELLKMLTEGNARRAFALLDETGILPFVLPEVAAMKQVAQPETFHPEGDVFEHTMLMLEYMDTPSPTLAMAALLHDAGKPCTQTFEDRIRFNHHEKAGARIADGICRRLRFSNEDRERIVWLVAQHMRVACIPEMRESKRKRFVREDAFDELLTLSRLDCLASHGDQSIIAWIEEYRKGLTPEEVRPEPLLRGNDLIEMGYAPGPLFTRILSAVEDAQLEGILVTIEDARQYVRARWAN